ncbi:MAG TPA: TadE/TadG family type IV pilus assembly protein [Bryobacteraceae bacterium]|nr:TadE/TadG family type IV pilus assembly protein [Bryobacteraceae bacterium]
MRKARHSTSRRGSAMVEFALAFTFLLPLLFGGVTTGINLRRSIQAEQIARDAGHMYASSVDFSDSSNQAILIRLTEGLNMTATGGDGVIILSTVTYVTQDDCTAAGLKSSQCVNANQSVVVNRIVIGNSSLRTSQFGTPTASLIDSEGDVSNYLTDTSARATGFGSVLSLGDGDLAYVAEDYFTSPSYNILGYHLGGGVAARMIF